MVVLTATTVAPVAALFVVSFEFEQVETVYVKFDVKASFVVLASVEPFGEAVLAVKVCAAAV